MLNYTLTRSNRKTISIHIRNGTVEVRAPLKCPKSYIDEFVVSKEKWITDKLAISHKQVEGKKTFTLDYGSEIYFCGTLYSIVAGASSRAGFDGECFYMPPNLTSEQIKQTCINAYRRLAKIRFINAVVDYAPKLGVSPTAIKINSAKTRWGSCSSKKSLNFSWRLVMADNDVIDYVVVHELVHILQMNHSSKFWAIVEGVLPDYKKRQAKLKELQRRLSAEDWE